jgi:ABC-2 type transport system ATP-binding protein
VSDAIISTHGLSKRFGSLNAVDDLNLEIEQGSITGLVGPNGAGKSTTFLMLATLLEPSEGRVNVCGFDPVRDPRAVRRHVGYMPDFFGIYDDLSVDEYLDFFGSAYGLAPSRRRAISDDLLALVDLADKRYEQVDALSRGMKQRLCLARALLHDPDLLILDEPASGLDPRGRIELRGLLLELQRMGKTVLISSHILTELQEVCSHVAILDGGRLIAQGEPSTIGATPTDLRRYLVRALGDTDLVRTSLAGFGAAEVEVRNDGAIIVEFDGGDPRAAGIVRGLVMAGIDVVQFTEEIEGLEELFLRVTKGSKP